MSNQSPNCLVVYTIAYLSTVASGISATLFSAYLPLIVQDLTGATDRATIAHVGSQAGAAFLFGWAVGAIFLGALGDRVGRRMALFVSVMITTLGIIATAYAPSVIGLIVIRFITGGGAGSALLMSAVMVSEVWTTEGRSRAVGILANAFPVGLIVSGVVGSAFTDWRTAYHIGGATVVLGAAILLFVPESARWHARNTNWKQQRIQREKVLSGIHRKDLIAGIVLFGAMLVGLWAVFVWMPTFVGTVGAAADAQHNRALATLALGLGSVAGGFLSGPFSERFGRKGAVGLGYLGCIVLSLVTFIPEWDVIQLIVLAFVLSLFIGINQGVLVTYVPELFPTLIRGVATGLCFNLGRLVTVAGVVLAGFLITELGGYHNAILSFAVAYAVGFVMLHWARETRGQDLPE